MRNIAILYFPLKNNNQNACSLMVWIAVMKAPQSAIEMSLALILISTQQIKLEVR